MTRCSRCDALAVILTPGAWRYRYNGKPSRYLTVVTDLFSFLAAVKQCVSILTGLLAIH
jgi:hypothetical protein